MIVALLCASAHLITMLVTRWGDTKATSKSLVFSALLHMGCIVGLIVFTPPAEPSSRIDREEEPVFLTGVVEAEPPREESIDSSRLPVWEQLNPVEPPVQERSPQAEREPVALADPDRHSQQEVFDTFLPQVSTQPDDSPAEPEKIEKPAEVVSAVKPAPEQPVPSEITSSKQPREENPFSRQVSRRELVQESAEATRMTRNPSVSGNNKNNLKLSKQIEVLESDDGAPVPVEAETGGSTEKSRAEIAALPAPSPLPQTEKASESDVPNPLKRLRTGSSGAVSPKEMKLERSPRKPGAVSPQIPLVARNREGLGDEEAVNPEVEPAKVPELKAVLPQPENYQLRNLAKRKENARKNGGTAESEQSVEQSLKWLASVQHPEGYWDADRHGAGQVTIDENGVDRKQAGKQSDSGLTALTVLAYLGAGYTHEEGQYSTEVRKALRWLVRNQQADGYLGGRAKHFERMYCHGMVTYALAEAYGMQKNKVSDPWLREPIKKGVQYLISQQNEKDGGWRYAKGQSGDMSMFGWQLMALKSAEISGIATPLEVKKRMVQFLKARSRGEHSGLAAYREKMGPTRSMTAEALYCKQILGINRTNPACEEAVEYMMQNLPTRQNYDLYYWYYGTLSMYQYGHKPWRQWNGRVRDLIVSGQRTTGLYAGSWDPTSTWSPYGGRIYSTVMSTLCLEVYYRFLPLYRVTELDEPTAIPVR